MKKVKKVAGDVLKGAAAGALQGAAEAGAKATGTKKSSKEQK